MTWLIGLVVIMQTFFYLVFKPIILFTTPLFEARAIWIVLLGLLVWTFSGRNHENDFR